MKKFKSKKIFVILAILLGNFGLHQLYIANYKKALIYFVFSWTGIPYILSIYDIFTIRKQFNKIKKTNIIEKKFNQNNKENCQLSNNKINNIKEYKKDIEVKNLLEKQKEILLEIDLKDDKENIINKENLIKLVNIENKTIEEGNYNSVQEKKELIQKMQIILQTILNKKELEYIKLIKSESESFKKLDNVSYNLEEDEKCYEEHVLTKKINSISKYLLRFNEDVKLNQKFIYNINSKKERIKNKKFYDEDSIILDKYKNIRTPKEIINSFNICRMENSFILDSIKYSNMQGLICEFEPFMQYWPTFRSLNHRQKQWYFYWRSCVLSKNYIDTDLSYIFIFVYELLNYSFNKNAAFNISMLERLRDAYSSRYNTLEKYLNRWINDFLVELDQTDLIKENYFIQDKMYRILNENIDNLSKISITEWKRFIVYNNTKFFDKNKNKIYKEFKNNMVILNCFYKEHNKYLLNEWYDEKSKSLEVPDYRSAVIDRTIKVKQIKETIYEPNDKMHNQITQMFRLSENLVRERLGEKRKIKVESEHLPIGFMEYYDKNKEEVNNLNLKERFKEVTSNLNNLYVKIPKRINNDINESIKINPIVFDEKIIADLGREGEKLINIFNEKYEENIGNKNEKLNLTNYNNSDNDLMQVFCKIDSKNDEESNYLEDIKDNDICDLLKQNDLSEDTTGFIKSLDNLEIQFISKFDQLTISTKEATTFAKENCKMISIFIEGINQKALKFIGEPFISLENSNYTIYEEYINISNKVKELRKNED